jgi:sugar-specific transcriptional regulator TrmB
VQAQKIRKFDDKKRRQGTLIMQSSSDLKHRLQKLGLNESQAQIYLLLLNKGEARIQEIVGLTNIPRSTVYESLKILYEYGLAEEIVDGNFKRIRPYSIGSMKHNFDEKIQELKKLNTELDELEKVLSLPSLPSLASTSVRYYKGLSGARQIFWNSLKAKNTVYVYSEYGRPKYVGEKFYANFAQESRERNINEKVLINFTPRVQRLVKTYLGSPAVRTKLEDLRALKEENILIKGETLIYDNIYAQVYLYTGEINGFEIESSQFTQSQRSIFETLWYMATPVVNLLSHPRDDTPL